MGLPREAGPEFLRKCFHHDDEEQGTEDRALVNSDFDIEGFTNGVVYTHRALAVAVHSHDDLNDPLSDADLPERPSDNCPWDTVKGLLQVNTTLLLLVYCPTSSAAHQWHGLATPR